jgi:Mrp family chromosome partitioning ATPase/capsular polysaccharide biosynthesis protein
MTHDSSMQEPHYGTIRDYLQVVRRYRVMIAVVAVLGAGLGLFLALRQESVYQAAATVDFKDPTSEFSIFGLSPTPTNEPATQQAAANARNVTRPAVLNAASRKLKVAQLGATISTAVEPSSALVDVIAQSSDPTRAAQAANAVAVAAVATSNRRVRARFAAAAHAIHQQSGHVGNGAGASTQLFTQSEIARLDSLSHFAQAANLVARAAVPSSRVSPKPTRNAVLGLIGGVLAGLLLAFFRDSLDRRLRNADDIQANFELPVLGYVRDEAMGKTAYFKNGSSRGGVSEADVEAFRIMRKNLDFVKPSGEMRSILVTSALPSEGKTTVSSSLAFTMAVGGKRVLLVECDLRRPVLASRLGIAPAPGLSDYLAGHAEPAEILRTVKLTDPPVLNGAGPGDQTSATIGYSVVCIPAGTPTPHAAELLGSDRLKAFLDQVTEIYDAVILDSSPLLPVADARELLPHVDGLIVCARELQTTREQARATRETLDHLPERPTVLVITGVRPSGDDYAGYTYSYTHSSAS